MVNWKLLSPAGLIIAGIAGCGPLNFPYIYASVGRPSYQTDGAILVSGSYFTPSTKYNVGIFTNGAPRMIGKVQADSAGNINQTKIEYSCNTTLQIPINVEIYIINGPGLAQTNTVQSTCF